MNLRRTSILFPEEIVTLISNRNQIVPRGVKLEIYEKNYEWYEVESRLGHPRNFRNNFWMTSLGRFIALAEYQRKINSQILHIESDVIISRDFPIDVFRNAVTEICFPVLSLERGIASVLFLPSSETSETLVQQVKKASDSDALTSDMLVLGNLYHSNAKVIALPIGPNVKNNYRSFTPQDLQENWLREVTRFRGVFDGWDIGGFYFGTDPRNARGKSFLQREVPSEFADVKTWKIKFSDERNFVELNSDEGVLPVYSLHLTSKQLTLFKVKLPKKKIEEFLKPSSREYQVFYLRIFLNQAILALIRRLRTRENQS
jgi:hypothetical protein